MSKADGTRALASRADACRPATGQGDESLAAQTAQAGNAMDHTVAQPLLGQIAGRRTSCTPCGTDVALEARRGADLFPEDSRVTSEQLPISRSTAYFSASTKGRPPSTKPLGTLSRSLCRRPRQQSQMVSSIARQTLTPKRTRSIVYGMG